MRAAIVAPFLALAAHALPQNDPGTFGDPTSDDLSIGDNQFTAVAVPNDDLAQGGSSTTSSYDTTVYTLSTTTVINTSTSTYGGTTQFVTYTTVVYGGTTVVVAGPTETGYPASRPRPSGYMPIPEHC